MKIIYLYILGGACLTFSCTVFADLLIDLESEAEISISNTEYSNHYTIKIEEHPELNDNFQPSMNSTMSNKINNLPYYKEVILAAQETSLDPALIHAIITVESKYNAFAHSKKGAYGLMQLMPETAVRFNVHNKNDTQQNILAGARYIRELLTKYNGDLNLSLAAYNAGPAAVTKYGGKIPPYRETLTYVPKVLKFYRQYS